MRAHPGSRRVEKISEEFVLFGHGSARAVQELFCKAVNVNLVSMRLNKASSRDKLATLGGQVYSVGPRHPGSIHDSYWRRG